MRVAAYKTRDYLNGLDPGLWMVGDACKAVKLFTQNERLLLWCMVPKDIREKQIESVNHMNKRYNNNEIDTDAQRSLFCLQPTELPRNGLTNLLLAVLDLRLKPVSMLKKKFFRGEIGEADFHNFADQLSDPSTRMDAWVNTSLPPMWVWALSKFFRDCGCNAGNFIASLDTSTLENFVLQFYLSDRTTYCFFIDDLFEMGWGLNILRNHSLCDSIQSKILTGLSLRDLSALSSVNTKFRHRIWLHLFHCPPSHYEVPKSEIFVWLCAMKRRGYVLPKDIRKIIARLAQYQPGDVRIYWSEK